MFESAELGHKLDKTNCEKILSQLRTDLLNARFKLKEQAKNPIVMVISGNDGAGKGDTINTLYEWMDPRPDRPPLKGRRACAVFHSVPLPPQRVVRT